MNFEVTFASLLRCVRCQFKCCL